MYIDRENMIAVDGYVTFVGTASELRKGDIVLNAEYLIVGVVEHEDDSTVTLKLLEYPAWTAHLAAGSPTLPGIPARKYATVTLQHDSLLRFAREVATEPREFDPQDVALRPYAFGNAFGDNPHRVAGLTAVKTRELDHGDVIYIRDTAGQSVTYRELVVDSVFMTGVILASDGTAVQSEPDLFWHARLA